MHPILWPTCECTAELAARLPEILNAAGFSVNPRQVRPSQVGVTLMFDYAISDGVRRVALIGIKHRERGTVIVCLRPLRNGWRLAGLFGPEKFAMAVIECLVREGAAKSPFPDEGKLRFLANSGDPSRARHANAMLAAIRREKKKNAGPGAQPAS
jgi:hypothetical protein